MDVYGSSVLKCTILPSSVSKAANYVFFLHVDSAQVNSKSNSVVNSILKDSLQPETW